MERSQLEKIPLKDLLRHKESLSKSILGLMTMVEDLEQEKQFLTEQRNSNKQKADALSRVYVQLKEEYESSPKNNFALSFLKNISAFSRNELNMSKENDPNYGSYTLKEKARLEVESKREYEYGNSFSDSQKDKSQVKKQKTEGKLSLALSINESFSTTDLSEDYERIGIDAPSPLSEVCISILNEIYSSGSEAVSPNFTNLSSKTISYASKNKETKGSGISSKNHVTTNQETSLFKARNM